MHKMTLSYEDYNGDTQTVDLHFNLNRSELLHNLDIREEFEELGKKFAGRTRTLESKEVMEMLAVMKRLVHLSYGIRTADGKFFRKTEQYWTDFIDSGQYDAFLLDLFEHPEKMEPFVNGVMPRQIVEAAKKELASNAPEDATDETPVWIREGREPNQDEVRNMTPEQLRSAWMAKASQ